jgi:hypothetical protein
MTDKTESYRHPYGAWTERDGSVVLFDRKYKPICRYRADTSEVEVVAPDQRISFVRETWFDDDASAFARAASHQDTTPTSDRYTREA